MTVRTDMMPSEILPGMPFTSIQKETQDKETIRVLGM